MPSQATQSKPCGTFFKGSSHLEDGKHGWFRRVKFYGQSNQVLYINLPYNLGETLIDVDKEKFAEFEINELISNYEYSYYPMGGLFV